jgi:hypothetical protein
MGLFTPDFFRSFFLGFGLTAVVLTASILQQSL